MGWDILGHEWAADMLRQHIATGQLRHAYLFTGPGGVGRRTLALRFAQAANCTQPPEPGVPCRSCRTCEQIERMQQTDLTIVQSEAEGESLKIEQVRELQHKLALAPYESNYRVALLLRFQEATDGAQNALLKTLEEPNPKVLLLVTADDPDNLLPTILSRCELLRLRPMTLMGLEKKLIDRNAIDQEKARLLSHVAGGRPGYAFRLAENDELWAAREMWVEDFFKLISSDQRTRLAYSESKTRGLDRSDARIDLRDGFSHWLSIWRDVLLISAGSDTPLTNLDHEEGLRAVAETVTEQQAARLVGRLEHSFARLPVANLQLMLDNLLLEWPNI